MSNEHKRRGGPPPGRGMNPGEKPKNLSIAITRLTSSLGKFKISILISLVLAGLSAVLALSSPNILKDLTNEISNGLVINTEGSSKLQEDLLSNLDKEKLPVLLKDILDIELNQNTIYKVNSSNISSEDKQIFNNALDNIANDKENMPKYLGDFPESILSLILNTSNYSGIEISKEDKITLIKNMSNIDIENILSEMTESLMTTQPFTIHTSFIGDIVIGNGTIKVGIPFTERNLVFNSSDLQNLREMLTIRS